MTPGVYAGNLLAKKFEHTPKADTSPSMFVDHMVFKKIVYLFIETIGFSVKFSTLLK
jgi:hypothetical protein